MNAALKFATYEDLLKLPDEVTGEILYGMLHTQPRPHCRHAQSAMAIASDLHGNFGRGGGPDDWRIQPEPELHLGPHVLVPDIAGWRCSRMPVLPDSHWTDLAPDWICEVLSPSTARKDRVLKMQIYAEFGVAHAWLVDPGERWLEVHELDVQGRWVRLSVHQYDDVVRAPPFATLALSLRSLWPDEPAG